jgi:membrane fusion protein, copper/silver efflux system
VTDEQKMDRHPGRRFGVGALLGVLGMGLCLGGGGSYLVANLRRHPDLVQTAAPATTRPRYVCPMHPTITSDAPGDCPICGMKLVLQGASAIGGARGTPDGEMHEDGSESTHGERKVVGYRSPMDPRVTSPVPRKDEMGMEYLPIYEDELNGGGKVEGMASVNIEPQRQQLIGLRTTPVTRGEVGGSWRTVGRVAVDETRVHHVNVKVSGFADQVYVDYVGKSVKAGQPLFSIYSPDLLSAEQDYVLAVRTKAALGDGGTPGAGDDLVAAARERLKLWDISEAELERLEKTGHPQKTLTLYAPMNGVVTKKDVVMGHRLQEGDMPYEITDLSEVWVLADAYESDLARLKLGTSATLSLPAFPNHRFKGRIIFIDPILDPTTRTAKVRLEFPNPNGDLRPEMFGEVTLESPRRDGLRIPSDAIIDSGTRKVVFVAIGEGKFQPREVKLGTVAADSVEVLDGLKEGERVVTRANFLIDSESRLRASLATMSGN